MSTATQTKPTRKIERPLYERLLNEVSRLKQEATDNLYTRVELLCRIFTDKAWRAKIDAELLAVNIAPSDDYTLAAVLDEYVDDVFLVLDSRLVESPFLLLRQIYMAYPSQLDWLDLPALCKAVIRPRPIVKDRPPQDKTNGTIHNAPKTMQNALERNDIAAHPVSFREQAITELRQWAKKYDGLRSVFAEKFWKEIDKAIQ